MSAISLKSITGITSITAPAGVDNQLTLHTNNTTERFKIDVAGNVHVNNHLAVTGVTTFNDNTTFTGASSNATWHKGNSSFELDDNTRLKIGNSADLSIYHTPHNSFIVNNTGTLNIQSDTLRLTDAGLAHLYLKGTASATELYHDNNVRLTTTDDGITVDKGVTINGIEGGDAQIRLRADQGDDNNDMFRFVVSDGGTGLHIQGYDGSFHSRITVATDGKVGINDTTPDATLSVGGATAFIDVGAAGGNRGKIGYSSNDLYFGTSSSNGEFIFKNNINSNDNPASSGTERLRIASDGRVTFTGTNEQDIIHITTGNTAGNTFANIRGDNEAGIKIRGGGSSHGGTIELAGGLRNTDPGIIKFFTGTSGASTERLRITSSGRVGINTNNPGSNLTVWANDGVTDTDVFQVRSKTGAFNIQVSDSNASNPEWALRTYSNEPIVFKQATTERLRLDSNGRLVIGHTVALEKFHGPYGTTKRNPKIQINGTNVTQASMSLTSWDNNVVGYYGPAIFLAKSGSSTIGSNSRVSNLNSILGSIIFSGDDGDEFIKAAMIQAAVDTSTGGNDMPGRLMFLTTPDGAQEPLERLRIDHDGSVNVGLSNTFPGLRYFDIQNNSSAAANHGSIIRLITSNAAGNSTTSVDMVKYKDGNFYINNNESSGSTRFNTGGSTSLTINSDGDVGIGVDPTSDFHLKRTSGAVLHTIEASAAGGEALYKCLGKSSGNDAREVQFRYDSGADAHRIITSNNIPIQLCTQNTPRLNITGTGNLQQNGGSGISYFKGSSEYIFGSNTSSPPAGGSEARLQIHDMKTRGHFSINAYMNNAGGPTMQFVSSRSSTVGTLGTKVQSNDYIGEMRFFGDNATNYNTLAQGGTIWCRAKSTPADGDTVIAAEFNFDTGSASGGSISNVLKLRHDQQVEMPGAQKVKINGVIEYYAAATMRNDTAYNFDFTVRAEGGYGNSYYIVVGYNHFHTSAYGAQRVAIVCTRGTSLTINSDITNQSHSQAGGWSFSKPNSTTLRITKSAGTYGGTGYGFIRMTGNGNTMGT